MLEYRIVEDGHVFTETYLLNGELHREDGPASVTRRFKDGQVAWETWYRHGGPHREDGPAVINYNLETGRVEAIFYFQNGQLCRTDGGPECIEFDPKTGQIIDATWWQDDEPAAMTLSHWMWLNRAREAGAA